MQINQQPIFETLQDNQNYTLKSILGSDLLKLRFVIKNKGKTNQVYDALIRSLDNQGKLSQYFQSFQQFKEYLKIGENIKLDPHRKVVDVVSKGPTKKSNLIQLAHFKLSPVQIQKKTNGKDHKVISNISSQQAQQWMDTLATQIVNIIEHKSQITSKTHPLRQYIKKGEVESMMQQMRKQLKEQMNNYKNQIQILRQKIERKEERQEKRNSLRISLQSQNQNEISSKLPNQKVDQLVQIKWEIQELNHKLDKNIQQNRKQLQKLFKEQLQKTLQNVNKSMSVKFLEMTRNYSTKQQMDVFIKKLQNIGNKLEAMSAQKSRNLQKDKNQDMGIFELGFPGRVNSEFQLKLNKQQSSEKSSKQTALKSPRKRGTGSEYIPISPVNADTWVDPKCSHFGRVSINGNAITLSAFGGAHLFGRIPIKKTSTFHISIESLKGKFALGVIDSSYKQNLLYGQESLKIQYHSNKKFVCGKDQKHDQGEGLFKGQTITVCVDVNLGTILWKSGTNLKHSWQSDDLRNLSIEWVPYVKMYQKGDRISIVE